MLGPRTFLVFLVCMPLLPQAPPMSLRRAVEQAVKTYPSVQVSQEQLAAAAAGIQLARTSYLPRVDAVGQLNRATRNNVFGMLLPQPLIPAISGPPLPRNSMTSVWGSAVGFLVSWEPFDFGLRRANVQIAETERKRAEAAVERARFEVAATAADTYLTLLAAEQTVHSAESGVERARVLDRVVSALVKADLRPGADSARSQAELAVAETQLIQAQQAVQVARATLAQLIATPAADIRTQAGPLLDLPGEERAPEGGLEEHPAAVEQRAAIDEAKARQTAVDRSWYPRFNVQGASYARGTGANPDGTVEDGAAGIGPNIYNWGVGLTVTFPLLEFPALKARREAGAHRERAEAARYDQLVRELTAARERAQATLDGARRVAANTPKQLAAATAAEQQASARYRAGLGTLIEVAEAQRLHTQAEIDDSLARLGVWRAMLGVATAEGDVRDFVTRGSR